jgi:hypothetical protein
MAAKKKTVKKMHRMPDGTMMKGAKHSSGAKHEKTESKTERMKEYGKRGR